MKDPICETLIISNAEFAQFLKQHLQPFKTGSYNGKLYFENECGEERIEDDEIEYCDDNYYINAELDDNSLKLDLQTGYGILKTESILNTWFLILFFGDPNYDEDDVDPKRNAEYLIFKKEFDAFIKKLGTVKTNLYGSFIEESVDCWTDNEALCRFDDEFDYMINEYYCHRSYSSAEVHSSAFATALEKYCCEHGVKKGKYYTFETNDNFYAVMIKKDIVYSTAEISEEKIRSYFRFLDKEVLSLLDNADYTECIHERCVEDNYDEYGYY